MVAMFGLGQLMAGDQSKRDRPIIPYIYKGAELLPSTGHW